VKTKKEILANRAISRARSGLYFLEECLTHIHRGGTDAAYSRSIYILFSYNFELILKSRLLLASSFTEQKELIKEVKSHDLEKLSKKLSKDELSSIGVEAIKKEENFGFIEYVVELIEGNKITLQDLTDVRYDFEKDVLRNSDKNESNRMQAEVEALLKMTKKIKKMLKIEI
jgi:hypothetical protein